MSGGQEDELVAGLVEERWEAGNRPCPRMEAFDARRAPSPSTHIQARGGSKTSTGLLVLSAQSVSSVRCAYPDAAPSRTPIARGRERGHVTADDFKAFTHDNALALWGDEMFANTVIAAR